MSFRLKRLRYVPASLAVLAACALCACLMYSNADLLQLTAGEIVQEEPPEPDEIPIGDLKGFPVNCPPKDLRNWIKNMELAEVLGKAFFWDMQVGSDGRQACATCHFHAGADVRTRNSLGLPPGAEDCFPADPVEIRGANVLLKPEDFPFHKFADPLDRDSEIVRSTGEVCGSQGIVLHDFVPFVPTYDQQKPPLVDDGILVPDPVFNFRGINVRRVEPRNANHTINAVFNDRQFWDGRANRFFNGVNPFGDTDPSTLNYVLRPSGQLDSVHVLIDNSSLASQAVGPPLSGFEMSFRGRTFGDLARKMLCRRPLKLQQVHPNDSVLGPYKRKRGKGLGFRTYAQLIRKVFKKKWWISDQLIETNGREFTQMECNFSLFWGLTVQIYEKTLISDETPFDRFSRGDESALDDKQQEGLRIFLNEGRCANCHKSPVFSGAAKELVRADPIEFMIMQIGPEAFYDNGFYNIGVRPTCEDVGVGGSGPFGPFSLAARKQFKPSTNVGGQDIQVPDDARLAVDGAMKVPNLRNAELTGPYMHNGGMKNLTEVVQFYARRVDFFHENIDDLDPDVQGIPELIEDPSKIDALVCFLLSLTDERVACEQAPFDHPEIFVTNGHSGFRRGVAKDILVRIPERGAAGGPRLPTFEEILENGRFRN